MARFELRSYPVPNSFSPQAIIGDRKASRRHNFLGQRPPTVPVGDARARAIGTSIMGVAENLQAAVMEVIENELGPVSRGRAYEIPVLGETMSSGEILTQVLLDLGALDAVAFRLERGAAQPYIPPEARPILEGVHAAVLGKKNSIPAGSQEPISPGNRGISGDHTDRLAGSVMAMAGDIERMVVEAEGPGVAVREPGEASASVVRVIAGIAVVAVLGYGLYALFGGD